MKAPRIFNLIPVLLLLMFSIASFAQQPLTDDPGLKKYGNVAFADSVHHKYPIDTDQHIRIAWAFIHEKSHAAKYSKQERKEMMIRIREAAVAHGIHFKSKG
jgi:hypothetical protein